MARRHTGLIFMCSEWAQFIPLLAQDTEENLETMARALSVLERCSGHPEHGEALDALFRAAHSIKAAAAAMGIEMAAQLAHAMEDALQAACEQRQPPGSEWIATFRSCADFLRVVLDATQHPGFAPPAGQCEHVHELIASLRLLRRPASFGAPPAPSPQEQPLFLLSASTRARMEEYRLAGARVACVRVCFAGDAPLLGARMHLVARNLRRCCDILALVPDPDTVCDSDSNRVLTVLVASSASDEEIRRSADVAEVISVTIQDAAETTALPLQTTFPPPAGGEPAVALERRDDWRTRRAARVELAQLDRLFDLTENLLLGHNHLVRSAGQGAHAELLSLLNAQGTQLVLLLETLVSVRMTTLTELFQRLQRIARDLARDRGKPVSIEMCGEETKIDKKTADMLADPLTHMIRNAIDHGLETAAERAAAGKPREGRIRLAAACDGSAVTVTMEDDGRGLDIARLRRVCVERGIYSPAQAAALSEPEICGVIFLPGVSTAAEVTAVSGRGVGMDIVRRNVSAIGGTIDVDHRPGRGVRFVICAPLSLARLPVVLLEANGEQCAVPAADVRGACSVSAGDIRSSDAGDEWISWKGNSIPLVHVSQRLGMPRRVGREPLRIVIVEHADRRAALAADHARNEPETAIVRRRWDPSGDRRGVAGSVVRPDGSIAMLLDMDALLAGGVSGSTG